MDEKLIRKNLNQLDGTPRSAVKLLTELTDEQIEALGGIADERRVESTEDK